LTQINAEFYDNFMKNRSGIDLSSAKIIKFRVLQRQLLIDINSRRVYSDPIKEEVFIMSKFMMAITISFVFILSACGGDSGQQESAAGAKMVSPQFRAQLSDAAKVYFELKDALVAANAELAVGKAKSFKEALGKIDATGAAQIAQGVKFMNE